VERTTIAGETEELGENLPSATLYHHKSHMTRSGFEPPDRSGGKPATNRLSYGSAIVYMLIKLLVIQNSGNVSDWATIGFME
jgi:hypothetical protein